MNVTLMAALLRQRITSPFRAILLSLAFVFPLLLAIMTGSPATIGKGTAAFFAIVLAAGIIGQDVSSGVLQLLFARPVKRAEYVLARWLAAGSGAFVISLAQVLIATAWFASKGHAPEAGPLEQLVLENALAAFGTAAVLAMLSSLVGGLGDLGLYFLGVMGATIVEQVAGWKNWPIVVRAAQELSQFLQPQPELAWIAGGSAVSWFAIASYLSTVTLSLAVAIAVLNRKELSYAAG